METTALIVAGRLARRPGTAGPPAVMHGSSFRAPVKPERTRPEETPANEGTQESGPGKGDPAKKRKPGLY